MAATPQKFKALWQALSRPFRGTGANATSGWVPKPPSGTATTDVLRADATWGPVSSSGGMASWVAGTDLDGGTVTNGETVNHSDSAVTPGSYTSANITVNQRGHITAAASSGGVSDGDKGDVEVSGSGTVWTVESVAGVTPGAGGLAILDDANAAAMRTTLELGTAAVLNAADFFQAAVEKDGPLLFSTAGVGAPTFTTRSAGSKVVLYPSVDGSNTDHAIGIEGGANWYGVPNSASAHIWYFAEDEGARLTHPGTLDLQGALQADTVSEHTAAAGVTIDGVLCKDGDVDAGLVAGTQVDGGTDPIVSLVSGGITVEPVAAPTDPFNFSVTNLGSGDMTMYVGGNLTAALVLKEGSNRVLTEATKLDDLAAPDDNTDLNASTSAHGLLKKLSNNAAEFMNGVGAWATPADAYPGLMLGVTFVYTDAHTITLDPSVNNPSGTALITLWDGSALKLFTISSSKTCDLAVSGAGGLDTGAEAASTGYYVWGIGKSDGTFALLFSTSATAPTMPSGYTYKRILYFVRNGCAASTTDICKFLCIEDGRGAYYTYESTSGDPGTILNGGTATTPTAIDLTNYVPSGANTVIGLGRATINSSVTTTLSFYTSSSGVSGNFVANVSTAAAQTSYLAKQFEMPIISALNTSIYYDWSAASAGRDALYKVHGWRW